VDHPLRRKRLAARLPELDVDAMLLTRLPNVRYVSGFTGSNGQTLVRTDGDGVFFTDGRYDEQSRREVERLERVVYSREFAPACAKTCARLGVRRIGFESAGVTYKGFQEVSEAIGETPELVPFDGVVERLRLVKEPDELRAIERAQAATDAAFEQIPDSLHEGMTEAELALELELAMRRAGADGLSFETIAAFGENAAEPHHEPTDRRLRRGDVVKLDFGALVNGYHADMTRTIALGEPPDELRRVHDLVRRAQQAGIDAVRAGVAGAEVDGAARGVIEEAGRGAAFPHGLGHGVGLEIHEGPSLYLTSEDVLPAGAVVTVEPGVYLAGLGGVRIEDMVEVTEGGCRVLPTSTRELIIVP